ncbi:MAG: RNA polymerase subunit sigma-70, partial [Lapillicoccus sp.]
EITWLEPMPDTVVAGTAPEDPEATAVTHDSIRIAFIAALQHLTPTQRAVLILRDVLNWRAAEVASALDTTVAAVNSALQRARAHVEKLAPAEEASSQLSADDPEVKAKLERYVEAFEAYDIDTIVQMLTTDAIWDMPPYTGWYQGNQEIGKLIATQCPASQAGDMRMVPTVANRQPAYGLYMRSDDGRMLPFQLQQLTVGPNGVERVTAYFDLRLFETFGLPAELPAA